MHTYKYVHAQSHIYIHMNIHILLYTTFNIALSYSIRKCALSLSVLLFLSIYTVSFKLFCKLRFVIRMLLCLFVCVFYCNENQSSLTSLSLPVSLPSPLPLPNRFSTFSLPNIQHCKSVQFNCGFNCSLAIYTSLLRLSLSLSLCLPVSFYWLGHAKVFILYIRKAICSTFIILSVCVHLVKCMTSQLITGGAQLQAKLASGQIIHNSQKENSCAQK